MSRFLNNVNGLTAKIFATPSTNSNLCAAKKKSHADAQANILVQLQEAAKEKIDSINDFMDLEALVAVESLKGKVSSLEIARILHPNLHVSAPSESSSDTKKQIYKPNKDFLTARKKQILWYRVSNTQVPPEDLAALEDYLTSGGPFTDVKTPIMFIRKIMDPKTFKSFSGVIAQAIT